MPLSMCNLWMLHSKRPSKESNKYASEFALSLNIPPLKLFGWFRRLQLWATGDWQLHHNNMPVHASCPMQRFWQNWCFAKSPCPRQPRSGDLWLPAFPKTEIIFGRKRFQTIDRIQENTRGQLMVTGRTGWGPKVPTLKGTEASLSCVQGFLYLLL